MNRAHCFQLPQRRAGSSEMLRNMCKIAIIFVLFWGIPASSRQVALCDGSVDCCKECCKKAEGDFGVNKRACEKGCKGEEDCNNEACEVGEAFGNSQLFTAPDSSETACCTLDSGLSIGEEAEELCALPLTNVPTFEPTDSPTETILPTSTPTFDPTGIPTAVPSVTPVETPGDVPIDDSDGKLALDSSLNALFTIPVVALLLLMTVLGRRAIKRRKNSSLLEKESPGGSESTSLHEPKREADSHEKEQAVTEEELLVLSSKSGSGNVHGLRQMKRPTKQDKALQSFYPDYHKPIQEKKASMDVQPMSASNKLKNAKPSAQYLKHADKHRNRKSIFRPSTLYLRKNKKPTKGGQSNAQQHGEQPTKVVLNDDDI